MTIKIYCPHASIGQFIEMIDKLSKLHKSDIAFLEISNEILNYSLKPMKGTVECFITTEEYIKFMILVNRNIIQKK